MKRAVIYFLLITAGIIWCNSVPVIENFMVNQRTDGSQFIDVFYDLTDADGDLMTVIMQVSDDGGLNWSVNCGMLSGDVGEEICSGNGKQITWDFGAEHPGTFGDNYKIRLRVDDNYIPNLILIAGGSFNNGTSEVTVSSFYICPYEVTQSDYQTIMGNNPSNFTGVYNGPVERVSWFNAIEYCNWLSIIAELTPCYSYSTYGTNPADWPTGWNSNNINQDNISCNWAANGNRLPTEAEWQFAGLGGNQTNNYTYSGSNDIEQVAWYGGNSGDTTHTIGTKDANELLIFDISGNVWEWIWDKFGLYPTGAQTNPHGPLNGTYRVVRGGSWNCDSYECTVSVRSNRLASENFDSVGFRLCRTFEIPNFAPNLPENPYPVNGAFDLPVPENITLTWECSDPDGDELVYSVYFSEVPELDESHLLADGIETESWELTIQEYHTIYYWQIVASDGDLQTEGEVWSFATDNEEWAYVEGGLFEMGDHFNEGNDNELPVHEVIISSFYIRQYEITQGEYESVMGYCPAHNYGVGNDYPVYYVSWYDAVIYCNTLSEQEGLYPCYNLSDWSCDFSASGYRLPTEAEWEYAARGGINWTDNNRYSGTMDNLGDYAWYNFNSGGQTQEVSTKLPNQLEIYGMSGNVFEWCNDWYSSSYYESSPVNNPMGPDSGTIRVLRSGGWSSNADRCRVAERGGSGPNNNDSSGIGFRILRAVE
ncbi:MAG: SUMF1/EgtB/PvdO family nonheme iron enzyme [Candidatus Cloacimonetes bacterium]|nr:SUMF1/EgtB/PvdO family nonheme iron enzyme [Candidatus Cloacimonadota bacterium]